jgi:dTDP-4-amino-4,6-dideoxygalactose transaminase
VIIQHTFGIPANLDALMPLVKAQGGLAIEDCCHVCSSEYKGQPLGSFGDAAFYSYGHEKPISAGLGGGIVLNSAQSAVALEPLYESCSNPSVAEELWAAVRISSKSIFPAELVVKLRDLIRGKQIRLGESLGPWPDSECNQHLPKVATFWINRLVSRTSKIATRKRRTIQQLEQHIASLGLRHPAVPQQKDIVLWRYPLLTRNKPELLQRARECAVKIVDWGVFPFQWEGYLDSIKEPLSQAFPNARELAETTATIPIGHGLSTSYIKKLFRFLSQMSAEGFAWPPPVQ